MSNSSIPIANTLANVLTSTLINLGEKYKMEISTLIPNKKALIYAVNLYYKKEINNTGLVKLLEFLIENPETVESSEMPKIVEGLEILQISNDQELLVYVKEVIENSPTQVNQYKSGKIQVIGYLVGQCMKKSGGKGNPEKFKSLLAEALDKD